LSGQGGRKRRNPSKVNKYVQQFDALRIPVCLLRENLEAGQKVAKEEAALFNVARAVNLYPGTKQKKRPEEYLW
jgi:hypothetical protein